MQDQAKLSQLLDLYFEAYQQVTKIMTGLVTWPLTQHKLSLEQFLILRRLTFDKPVTLNDNANQRQVTRSAISRQIKALLAQNYISQEPDPEDRRRLYLHLTSKGAQTEKLVDQAITAHFGAWVQELGTSQVEEMIAQFQLIDQRINQLQTQTDAANLKYHQ